MWRAVRDNPAVDGWDTEKQGLQCIRTGFKWILFREYDEELYRDIDAYLIAEKPVPSPFLVDGKLSPKAERGKKIFEDPKVGCVTCHPAPLFTDRKMHDVNTKFYFNDPGSFDTPTLIETWRTAPYMHDGRYLTMQEVFKVGKHGDVAGDVDKLTDEQIDELSEYILSL
jgi:cytochrome c peroxidase